MQYSWLIAIDPGRSWGMAVFKSALLHRVFFGERGSEFEEAEYFATLGEQLPEPKRLVIEVPQVYPIRKWKGDPNDLIDVAVHVGLCAGALAPYVSKIDLVKPSQWKGSTPKAIDNKRTLAALSEKEKEVLKKKSTHVLDAIGLGLWALGRR